MNRTDHLNWAKGRALEYARQNDFITAYASMISDLKEHPETKNHPAIELFSKMINTSGGLNTKESIIKFIKDFA